MANIPNRSQRSSECSSVESELTDLPMTPNNPIFSQLSLSENTLLNAQTIQACCAEVGFDWTTLPPVVAKIKEELDEVQDELTKAPLNPAAISEEVGDLLFAVVNLARHLNVDANVALTQANQKFMRRFEQVEQKIQASGKSVLECTLEEMESLWGEVKKNE